MPDNPDDFDPNAYFSSVDSSVTLGAAADPDKAAQAHSLEQSTGVDGQTIYDNDKEFNDQYKRSLSLDIVHSNPKLMEYVNSHPLAASVSNDDWGNLNTFSQAADQNQSTLHRIYSALSAPSQAIGAAETGAITGAAESFAEGYGTEPIGSWLPGAGDPKRRVATAIESAEWSPFEVAVRLLNGTMQVPFGAAGGAAAGFARAIGASESNVEEARREATSVVESELGRGEIPHEITTQEAINARYNEAIAAAKPWTDNGLVPPRGVHPALDEAKVTINQVALDQLDQALATATQSATKERSTDLFRQFVQQHYGDRTIGIDGEAVSALYGDEIPTPGDGKLGFANIADQIALAKDTGADVHIPISDWLTNVDPMVAAALHDDIRMYPNGITTREATEIVPPKAVVDAPLAQVRSQGLEPMFAIGDRKLTLQPTDSFSPEWHVWQMLDENGKHVGDMEIAPDPQKKQLYIGMINGTAGMWANSFGPGLMRDLKRQLKEAYPGYETVTGHRVSGSRYEAGTWETAPHPVIKLDLEHPDAASDFQDFHQLLDNSWRDIGSDIAVKLKPRDAWTQNESNVASIIDEELQRIAPGANRVPLHGIYAPKYGGIPLGMYLPDRDLPTILYDLSRPDSLGTARHEAIHFLRSNGLFSTNEWGTLAEAAVREDWLGRYGIREKYADLSTSQQIEEAVAEGYREWTQAKDEGRTSAGPVSDLFQRIWEFLQRIRQRVGELFGGEPSWENLFERTDTGEIGAREPQKPAVGRQEPSFALGDPDLGDNLRANALGLDLATYRKLQQQLQEKYHSDLEANLSRAEREQKRTQTAEWKSNRENVEKEVEQTIRQRPDVAADLFVGSGELFGDKLRQRWPLRADDLTDAQKAMLPDHYYAKSGLPVDDVAKLFGYQTGDEMIDRLAQRVAERGDKTPQEGLRDLIKSETDRQMDRRYGLLEHNIMEDARDQALSETQTNYLAEEMYAAGMRAGQTTIDKDVAKAWIQEQFQKQPVGGVNSGRVMDNVAKHARTVERSLIAGDQVTAVQAIQSKFLATLSAMEARKFEKSKASFDRLVKKYSRVFDPTKSSAVDTEFSVAIRDILRKVELPNGRVRGWGGTRFDSLDDFVNGVEKDYDIVGLQLPVPDFLRNPEFKKPLNELSVGEFNAMRDAVVSLDKIGRSIGKINREGRQEDLRAWVDQARTQLANRFEAKGGTVNRRPGAVSTLVAASTSNETLMSRFDGRAEDGLFTTTITYPGASASNLKAKLERETTRDYAKLGPVKDGGKLIQSPFRDPLNGEPLRDFNRNNLAVIVSNMGNDYNWRTLCKGWGVDPDAMWRWVEANTTAEDIDRGQALGNIFKGLKAQADTVYQHLYGVAPENIVVRPFEMHGKQYEGWYHPIIGDKERSAYVNKLEIDKQPDFWPSTSNSYMKKRTGAVQVIDLTYDSIPAKLSQVIHDISFREFVNNTAKIFKDNSFRQAVTAHYGKLYMDEMDAWLKRVAGNASYSSGAMGLANRISNNIRQNVISTQIAFNVSTVEKHGLTAWAMSSRELGPNLFVTIPKFAGITAEVGASSFYHAVSDLFGKDTDLGESLWQFAKRNSEEIQRRERNWQDTMQGQQQIFLGKPTLRNKVTQAGAAMVAWSDMISAVPLWLAKYREAMAADADVGHAIEVADFAVRRAHGSTAITNLPRIAAGTDPVSPWLTSLYGFMGTSMQRRLEILHDLNDTYKLGMSGDIAGAAKKIPQILSSAAVYVVWTGLIEEWATSQFTDDRRGLGEKALGFTFGTAAQAIIGVRDLVHDLQTGEDSGGLISSPIRDFINLTRDVKKTDPLNRYHAGKLVQDGITSIGDLFGIGPRHIGTLARYGIDVFSGYAKPRSAGDVYRGVVSGSQRKRVER